MNYANTSSGQSPGNCAPALKRCFARDVDSHGYLAQRIVAAADDRKQKCASTIRLIWRRMDRE